MVAHRLSTIRNADQILVVDKGEVAARGTHGELLKGCPLYETMWRQYIGAADTAEQEVV